MTRAIALILVVLACSCMEGLWVWLLSAALSELDGQISPSLPFFMLLPFGSWLASRLMATSRVSKQTRRYVLIGGGFAIALAIATIHSGVVVPLQLILGHRDPDYRGSGVALGLLAAYLWARGLALAVQVNRRQALSHITVSAFLLANILLVLPLTAAAQDSGLEVVGATFFAALVALLLVQLADTETHQLRKIHWFGLAGASAIGMLIAAGVFTGVLSSGLPPGIGRAIGSAGGAALPITNWVLLGIGYVAEYLTYFILWLRNVYGGDPQAVERAQQEAEAARPRFNTDGPYGPPEIMTVFAMLVLVGFLAWLAGIIFGRLVQMGERRAADSMIETRRSTRDLALDGVRSALEWLPGFGPTPDRLAGRSAEIRRHYRSFQALMARANMPRAAAETVGEFQTTVTGSLPASRDAVATITSAYTLARYAEPTTALPDPDTVATALGQVRAALQAEAAQSARRAEAERAAREAEAARSAERSG